MKGLSAGLSANGKVFSQNMDYYNTVKQRFTNANKIWLISDDRNFKMCKNSGHIHTQVFRCDPMADLEIFYYNSSNKYLLQASNPS